jgi:hypothetical protein
MAKKKGGSRARCDPATKGCPRRGQSFGAAQTAIGMRSVLGIPRRLQVVAHTPDANRASDQGARVKNTGHVRRAKSRFSTPPNKTGFVPYEAAAID